MDQSVILREFTLLWH